MISRDEKVLSVGQLSEILKACFQNPAFKGLSVYGEVYSVRIGKFSYMEIGDPGKNQTSAPLLKCAFRTMYGDSYGLRDIQVGDVVTVTGDLSYYPHGSSVTLWGESVSLLQSQMGKNLLKRKKTLEKLEKLGYLDEKRKRPIPSYCSKVAIVTANNSAAYSDILKTLHERFPADTVLFPATVQGEGAAKSMLLALDRAKKSGADVIILGRGGGSKSDLSAFDDEQLALSIATSPIPVITCIGHTIDTAIADMVSDRKAITPTEGASLVNPSLEETEERRKAFKESLGELFDSYLDEKALALENFRERLKDLSPLKKANLLRERNMAFKTNLRRCFLLLVEKRRSAANLYREKVLSLFDGTLSRRKNGLEAYRQRLQALSPETIAQKGYALLYKDGRKVLSASELRKGDKVVLTYADGRKDATID